MGQRTTIIVQLKSEHQKRVETRVYHDQWGYGRIAPAKAMGVMLGTVGLSIGCSDFMDCVVPMGVSDVTKEFAEQMGVLNSIGFDRPELAGEIMQAAGNNNGGVLIRISEVEHWQKHIEYAFMLGHEEGGDYRRWCSFEQWCMAFPECCEASFRPVWYAVTGYLGAEDKGAK